MSEKVVSRQRRWQAKKLAEGKCQRCGRRREKYSHHCNECQKKVRLAMRQKVLDKVLDPA